MPRLSRLGRIKAYRVRHTRYTTLATQSVLRAQAFRQKAGSSSSGMFLLHLSMLSLLPLLFDSAHGHSAYGYPIASTSGSNKGKGREICTSATQQDEHAHAAHAAEAFENQPPITGFARESSRYHLADVGKETASQHTPLEVPYTNSDDSLSTGLAGTSVSTLASRGGSTMSSTTTDEEESGHATRYAECQQPGVRKVRQKSESRREAGLRRKEDYASTPSGQLRHQVKERLWSILDHPMPTDLSNLTPEDLHTMPVFQACELAKQIIALDVKEGNDPTWTAETRFFLQLLRMCEENPGEQWQHVIQQTLPEHVYLMQQLDEIAVMDEHGIHTGQTMRQLYQRRLLLELFDILEIVRQHRLQAGKTMAHYKPSINKQFLHAALASPEPSHAVTIWLCRTELNKRMPCNATEVTFIQIHLAPMFSFTIWPRLWAVLRIGDMRTIDKKESYLKALAAYTSIFKHVTEGGGSGTQHIMSTFLDAFMQLPITPGTSTAENQITSLPRSASVIDSTTSSSNSNVATASTLKDCSSNEVTPQTLHDDLFRSTHRFIISLLVGLLNRSLRASAEAGQSMYCITYSGSEWTLSLVDGTDEVPFENLKRIVDEVANDMRALTSLLYYVYRHMRSAEIGETFYRTCVEQHLISRFQATATTGQSKLVTPSSKQSEVVITSFAKSEPVNPSFEDSEPITPSPVESETITSSFEEVGSAYQRFSTIRLRQATVLQQNELAQSILDESITKLAEFYNMPEYAAPRKPQRLVSDHESRRFNREAATHWRRWQADILLRCTELNINFVTSALMYWISTSQRQVVRYFAHNFFAMRRQVQLLATPYEPGTAIVLTPARLEETPPLGTTINADIAKTRLEQFTATPEMIVTLLNVAKRLGNLSLAEKCWLVACEHEEASADWKVPTAAYTLILQVYGDEAARDLQGAKYMRKAARAIAMDRLPGGAAHTSGADVSASYSRITPDERANLARQHQQAWLSFSMSIYRRFTERMHLEDADGRFFSAALAAIGNNAVGFQSSFTDKTARVRRNKVAHHQKVQARRSDAATRNEGEALLDSSDVSDSGVGSSGESDIETALPQLERPANLVFLESVISDIEFAGLLAPSWALPYRNPNMEAQLRPDPNPRPARISKRATPPLVQWSLSLGDSSKGFFGVPFSNSRSFV